METISELTDIPTPTAFGGVIAVIGLGYLAWGILQRNITTLRMYDKEILLFVSGFAGAGAMVVPAFFTTPFLVVLCCFVGLVGGLLIAFGDGFGWPVSFFGGLFGGLLFIPPIAVIGLGLLIATELILADL